MDPTARRRLTELREKARAVGWHRLTDAEMGEYERLATIAREERKGRQYDIFRDTPRYRV